MHFTTSLFAAAFVAAANAAIITNTAADFDSVKAGTPFNITWAQASGPVTLTLKNGDPTALKTVEPIVADATATSFLWTPETSLTNGLYAFEIDDTSGPNYSEQFTLSGGAASSSAAASSTATSTGSSTSGSATTTSTVTSTSSSASTTGSSSTSASKSSTTTSGTSTSTTAAPTTSVNSSSGLASPLALVFLALAAIMTLH